MFSCLEPRVLLAFSSFKKARTTDALKRQSESIAMNNSLVFCILFVSTVKSAMAFVAPHCLVFRAQKLVHNGPAYFS